MSAFLMCGRKSGLLCKYLTNLGCRFLLKGKSMQVEVDLATIVPSGMVTVFHQRHQSVFLLESIIEEILRMSLYYDILSTDSKRIEVMIAN